MKKDAYEAQYKTGCETPVRTNSGERKSTNLVAFFFSSRPPCILFSILTFFLVDLVPSLFFKTGHQLPPVWGTLWITSCKQEVSSFHKGCSTRRMDFGISHHVLSVFLTSSQLHDQHVPQVPNVFPKMFPRGTLCLVKGGTKNTCSPMGRLKHALKVH